MSSARMAMLMPFIRHPASSIDILSTPCALGLASHSWNSFLHSSASVPPMSFSVLPPMRSSFGGGELQLVEAGRLGVGDRGAVVHRVDAGPVQGRHAHGARLAGGGDDRRRRERCRPPPCWPARMAFTSAWAVMSVVSTTVLCSRATTRSPTAMAQPNGLWPRARPSRHVSMAICIRSSGVIMRTWLRADRESQPPAGSERTQAYQNAAEFPPSRAVSLASTTAVGRCVETWFDRGG